MLKVSLIGIGNCGNQIAALAKKQGGINVACINTSENDIDYLTRFVSVWYNGNRT